MSGTSVGGKSRLGQLIGEENMGSLYEEDEEAGKAPSEATALETTEATGDTAVADESEAKAKLAATAPQATTALERSSSGKWLLIAAVVAAALVLFFVLSRSRTFDDDAGAEIIPTTQPPSELTSQE